MGRDVGSQGVVRTGLYSNPLLQRSLMHAGGRYLEHLPTISTAKDRLAPVKYIGTTMKQHSVNAVSSADRRSVAVSEVSSQQTSMGGPGYIHPRGKKYRDQFDEIFRPCKGCKDRVFKCDPTRDGHGCEGDDCECQGE